MTMAITYRTKSVLPITALAICCFVAGFAVAGAFTSHLAEAKTAEAARQAASVRTRVALLESVLRRQGADSASLSTPAEPAALKAAEMLLPSVAPAAAASVETPPVVGAARVPRAAPSLVPAPARANPPMPPTGMAVPLPSSAAVSVPTPIAVVPRVANVIQAADSLPKPVSAEALAAAKASNRIEGVSAEKIGVAKIENSGVIMRSGGRIPVGGRFPSGERLLAVDPVSGQIITDARTVLVFLD